MLLLLFNVFGPCLIISGLQGRTRGGSSAEPCSEGAWWLRLPEVGGLCPVGSMCGRGEGESVSRRRGRPSINPGVVPYFCVSFTYIIIYNGRASP